ncbi:MAG: hypothetical protein K5756_00200 [Clostridiales bacterium]|nr:hypothetical protein [Clostridiales bacterium]
MHDFIFAAIKYWYLTLALIALIILTVFVWSKALKASAKRNAEKRALIEKLEHEKFLRTEFKALTEDKIRNTDDAVLAEGIGTHIQMRLEQIPDMEAEFEKLSQPEKYAYAICYIVQDSAKGLSGFFRANGAPLTPCALSAAEEIIGGEYAKIFRQEYDMFDENNETSSYSKEAVEKLDKKAGEIFEAQKDDIFGKIKQYFIDNSECFVHSEA